MKRAAISFLILVSALIFLFSPGLSHAQEGLVWSDAQGAPSEQTPIEQQPVLHLLTSDPIYVSAEGIECRCCEHCTICFDQVTGERSSAFCRCVDAQGNYLGCGCECPFEINILDSDFLDKLNTSHRIYDAQGNVLSDRETWYQTYREAIRPADGPPQLGEGETLASYLQMYGEISGLTEEGGVFVDCGGSCHLDLPMAMNAIMPLSSQGPRWYSGVHGQGWICNDWADVKRVLTSTSTAPGNGGLWTYRESNRVYTRRAFMTTSMVTDGADITIPTACQKIQIEGFNPLTTTNSDDRSNWYTLDLKGTTLRCKNTASGDTGFISLAHGFYIRPAASDTDYTMVYGTTSFKQELELYHCDYIGGPVGDAGSNGESRVIVDDSTVTITRGKLGRAPVLDLNKWGANTARGTVITRDGIAGELFEFCGSSRRGIVIGDVNTTGGNIEINLGTAGHLFGASAASTASGYGIVCANSGATHFTLRGLGDAGKGLLSDGNALKLIRLPGGGSLTIDRPEGIEDNAIHAAPASGYGFVDVATFTYGAPFNMNIRHMPDNGATVNTLDMNGSDLNVFSGSTVKIYRARGFGSAIVSKNLTFTAGGALDIDMHPNSEDDSPVIAFTDAWPLTVSAAATMNVYTNSVDQTVMSNLTNLTVSGTMEVHQDFLRNGPATAGRHLLEAAGSVHVNGGQMTLRQEAGMVYQGSMHGGTTLKAARSVTVDGSGSLTINKQRAYSDAIQAADVIVGASGSGSITITQRMGDSAIDADLLVRVHSGGTIDITTNRLNSATVTEPVVRCQTLSVDAGANLAVKSPDNASYVQEAVTVLASGSASINGTMSLYQRCYNVGGGMLSGMLSVGGSLTADLFSDESVNGGIRATGDITVASGLIDIKERTTNIGNRTPALAAEGKLMVHSGAMVTVNYTGATGSLSSGGAGIIANTLACDGEITVNHRSGGGYTQALGELYAVQVAQTATIGIKGKMTVTRRGMDPALGSSSSAAHAMFADKVIVSAESPNGLYIYADDQAINGLVAPTALQIDAGGYLYAQKAANSAVTGSAVDCGTATIAGTAAIEVGNGRNGLYGPTTPVTIAGTGRLDIRLAGAANNQGVAIAMSQVSVARGGRLTIEQTAGDEAILVGAAGDGGLEVLGTATISRASGVIGPLSDAVRAGQVRVDGGTLSMTLNAGRHGLNTRAQGQGAVRVVSGGSVSITQDGNGAAQSAGNAMETVILESDASGNEITIAQNRSTDANAIHATGYVAFGKGSVVQVTQAMGGHSVWVDGSAGANTLRVDAAVTITKTGGGGNALRANGIDIGNSTASDNAHAVLTINQSAGTDTICFGQAGVDRMFRMHAQSSLIVRKTGGNGAVISSVDTFGLAGSLMYVDIEQTAGETTFDKMTACIATTPHRFIVRRNVGSNHPVIGGNGTGLMEFNRPGVMYIENPSGALLSGTGTFQLHTRALNFSGAAEEMIWNNTATQDFQLTAPVSGGTMTGVSSPTYPLVDNQGVGPNMPPVSTTTFAIASPSFHYLRAGEFDSFTIDQPLKGDEQVSGTTGSNVVRGEVYEYTIPRDGVLFQEQGPIAFTGSGAYNVQTAALDTNRSQVFTLAVDANGLKAYERADVQGWVSLKADDALQFADTNKSFSGTVRRAEASTNWKLTVTDNRGYMNGSTWNGGPGNWRVQVKTSGDLTNIHPPHDALSASFMFLRRDGLADMTLSTIEQLFHHQATGMPQGALDIVFQWPQDKGFLFQQGFTDGEVGGEYETSMTWTLVQ